MPAASGRRHGCINNHHTNDMKYFYKSILAAAVLATASTGLQARPVVVRGSLMTSDTSGTIYEITSDGTKTQLSSGQMQAASGGGTYFDGKYYMSKSWMSGYSAQTMTFDTSEIPWKSVASDADGSSTVLSTDYAYDGVANVIYGFHKQNGTNYVIGMITPGSSWSRKLVQVQSGPDMVDVKIDCSDADNRWHGIAFDNANQLWAITYGGVLNKVDKNTGAMTVVGETGIKPTVNGSAAFDMKTGKLYWAVKNASGSFVYEVNTTTAEAVKVIDVPDGQQLMGMYIPEPLAEDGAPAAVTKIHYDFFDGELQGMLVFDVPDTTFDDQSASGPLTYMVTIGDERPITGSTTFGATGVMVPFVVEQSGKVTVSVQLKNEVGYSPVTKFEAYVGYGKPMTPANAQLTYADGKMQLSWDAVTSVVNGEGYLGTMKYTVVRKTNSGDETVADGIEATNFEEAIAEPESGLASYTYEIKAVNGDMTSEAPASASLTIGSVALPYENAFETEDDFKEMTTINVEPVSKTWVWSKSGQNVTIGYDKAYSKDDWLITPPVNLHKGYTYTVSVSAKSQNSRYPEKVALAWGNAPTAAGMDQEIVAPAEAPTTATVYSGTFTAPETMKAYIGVHACSEKDMSTLTVDDFKVTETIPSGISAPMSEGEVFVSVNGATVTVKGAGNVMIVSADGRVVREARIAGTLSTELNAGIYIVIANGRSVKVIVK